MVHNLIPNLYLLVIDLAAVSLLLGLVNVIWMHLQRVRAGSSEWVFSLVLVIALGSVLAAGLVAPDGIQSPPMRWIFSAMVEPGQAALFALLPFFLLVAAYRHLRIDRPAGRWLLAGVVIMLVGQMPSLAAWLPLGGDTVINGLLGGPISAIVRGLLLGAALGSLVVGIRFLFAREK
jgi:hypothetical protein